MFDDMDIAELAGKAVYKLARISGCGLVKSVVSAGVAVGYAFFILPSLNNPEKKPSVKSRSIQVENMACKQEDYVLMKNARYYYKGIQGFPLDPAKAVSLWTCILAKKNSAKLPRAYNRLAYAFYYGRGISKNVRKAYEYWDLGARAGDVYAMSSYGRFCSRTNQNNGLCDYDLAVQRLESAIAKGHTKARQHLKALRQQSDVALDWLFETPTK